MKLSNTENKLKNLLLSDAKSTVDAHAIWDKIEDRAPKKKSPNRKLILWFSLGIIALISSILWYNAMSSKKVVTHKSTIQDDRSIAEKSSSESPKYSNKLTSKKVVSNNNEKMEMEQNQSEVILSNNNIVSKKQLSNSTKSKNTFPISKIYIKENNSVTELSNSTKSVSKNESSLKVSAPSKNSNQQVFISNKLSIIDIKPLTFKPQLAHKSVKVKIEDQSFKSYTNYTLGFGSIISGSRSQLVNPNSELNPSVFDSESNLPGIALSFQVSRTVSDNLSLYAALHVGQTVSRVQDNSSQIISETDTTVLYTNKDFQEVAEIGLVDAYQITNNIQWHRRHLNVDVEAGINFMLYKFNRFSLSSSSGVQLSVMQKHTGYYFDQITNQTIKFNNESNPYRKGIDYGLHFGLTFGMDFNRVSIGIKPTFRMYQNQLLEQSSDYNISKTQLGIQFTTTYRPSWVD